MEGSHGYIYRMQDKNKNTALFLVPDRIESSTLKKLIKDNKDKIVGEIKCTDQFIKDDVYLSLQVVEVNKKDMDIFKVIISDLYNKLLVMGYKDTLDEITEFFDKFKIISECEDGSR